VIDRGVVMGAVVYVSDVGAFVKNTFELALRVPKVPTPDDRNSVLIPLATSGENNTLFTLTYNLPSPIIVDVNCDELIYPDVASPATVDVRCCVLIYPIVPNPAVVDVICELVILIELVRPAVVE
jgi:hypothetical protein